MVIRIGKELVIAATVAPKPALTRRIGNAQHTRVPVVTNNASELRPVPPALGAASAIVFVLVLMTIDSTVTSPPGSENRVLDIIHLLNSSSATRKL
jgi:hypothetical protein